MEAVKQQISRLYYDNIDVENAVKLMRTQNISAEMVKYIYDQLSENVEKLMTDRFHYYNIKNGIEVPTMIKCWTSRYLISHDIFSNNSTFHEITIIDSFNDQSM
jgi:hypothetical protein